MDASARKTQRERILGLLLSARGDWVPLPKLTAAAAQYGTRILELRRLGFCIENRTQTVAGQRHSWFRLIPSAERFTVARPATQQALFDQHIDE